MTVSRGLFLLRLAGVIGVLPYRILQLLLALVGAGRVHRR
jgi:hypothetical protein